MMLKVGDRVGIAACSNGLGETEKVQLEELKAALEKMGLVPACGSCLFRQSSAFSGTGRQRADVINAFYRDNDIKAIFDISGGDIANEVLGDLDYGIILANPKPFFGYSDLTTVLNAIYAKTGNTSYLYQALCLVRGEKESQISAFRNSLLHGEDDLFRVKWDFLRGSAINGTVAGGNIRCFLKLAGTPYLPDLRGKVLFLESYGGGAAQMAAYLSQLKQMSVFDAIAGLLLGTFTKMDESGEKPGAEELVLSAAADYRFPIARTKDIGHGNTSRCLIIGKRYSISDDKQYR